MMLTRRQVSRLVMIFIPLGGMVLIILREWVENFSVYQKHSALLGDVIPPVFSNFDEWKHENVDQHISPSPRGFVLESTSRTLNPTSTTPYPTSFNLHHNWTSAQRTADPTPSPHIPTSSPSQPTKKQTFEPTRTTKMPTAVLLRPAEMP